MINLHFLPLFFARFPRWTFALVAVVTILSALAVSPIRYSRTTPDGANTTLSIGGALTLAAPAHKEIPK